MEGGVKEIVIVAAPAGGRFRRRDEGFTGVPTISGGENGARLGRAESVAGHDR